MSSWPIRNLCAIKYFWDVFTVHLSEMPFCCLFGELVLSVMSLSNLWADFIRLVCGYLSPNDFTSRFFSEHSRELFKERYALFMIVFWLYRK